MGKGSLRVNTSRIAIGPAKIARRTPVVAGSIVVTAILLATGVPPQKRTAKAARA